MQNTIKDNIRLGFKNIKQDVKLNLPCKNINQNQVLLNVIK